MFFLAFETPRRRRFRPQPFDLDAPAAILANPVLSILEFRQRVLDRFQLPRPGFDALEFEPLDQVGNRCLARVTHPMRDVLVAVAFGFEQTLFHFAAQLLPPLAQRLL